MYNDLCNNILQSSRCSRNIACKRNQSTVFMEELQVISLRLYFNIRISKKIWNDHYSFRIKFVDYIALYIISLLSTYRLLTFLSRTSANVSNAWTDWAFSFFQLSKNLLMEIFVYGSTGIFTYYVIAIHSLASYLKKLIK